MLPFPKTTLRRLPYLLALYSGRKRLMDGIVVIAFGRDLAEAAANKLAAALALLKQHTPKHYKRVQRFIPKLLVVGGHPYWATYVSELHLCHLSPDFVLAQDTSPERISMTLVHEATHGYLDSRGFAYSEQKRVQIERICSKAELAFAARLPQADALVAAPRQALAIASEYWTDAAFLRRHYRAALKAGFPKFLIRLVAARRLRLIRRSAQSNQPKPHPNGVPSPFRPLRSKRLWLLGLVAACLVCLGISYLFRDTTRIYGQLSRRDVAEIKTIIHRAVFTCPPKPAWLPSVFEPLLWAPLQRLISDVRHPIDVISLTSSGTVIVVYGGPEEKAYLNFKEHGYFPQKMELRKGPGGWLTKGPNGPQQILVFP